MPEGVPPADLLWLHMRSLAAHSGCQLARAPACAHGMGGMRGQPPRAQSCKAGLQTTKQV